MIYTSYHNATYDNYYKSFIYSYANIYSYIRAYMYINLLTLLSDPYKSHNLAFTT